LGAGSLNATTSGLGLCGGMAFLSRLWNGLGQLLSKYVDDHVSATLSPISNWVHLT